MTALDSAKIHEIAHWLIEGAPGTSRPEKIVSETCERMAAAGVPLKRVALFVRTLHPNIVGVSYIWRPGKPVEVFRAPRTLIDDPDYLRSPLWYAFEKGKGIRRRLADPDCPRDFPILADFDAEGVTDYVVSPLRYLSGENHVVTWTTSAPGGFTDDAVAGIESVVAPLTRLSEVYTLRRTAANLLNLYVGHHAGERILKGQISRGDTTTLEAAIWVSDLRGFTPLSEILAPGELIGLLNATFGAQVPAIEKHGGEVMKFMGDSLLAIFPASSGPEAACGSALAAAEEAYAACAALETIDTPTRIGLGLHVGKVSYGNIGGETRLDFTCIGPAVNLTSRLQGLAATEGWPMAMSEAFAAALPRTTRSLGRYQLKGLAEPVPVFAPS
ncbi:MAG: adenylate/guanylate cyclase domain-containing protein [Alphaproteobacteria bacterium]|nr:adenylate/guanylate cyclase domain-containing protein [Alphaproteobacteria bacterium]